MAETERPHRSSSINSNSNNARNASSSTSTDLFICFTSRFSSSSSMRLSSLSPARSACLTTSLSRRLRTSGSIKNASAGVLNSPMFGNNGGRKRSGSGYENTNNTNNIEPSSPKVTCIGQVRVKTRKHVKKKMRARSRRKGGETSSFRRSSSDQNDRGGCRFDASENRWVHFPVTICESLRSFGSELNCFSSSPCRSSCTGDSHHNRDRRVENNGGGCGGGGGGSSCFTRWFVAVEETGGKRREIELVVGGGDDEAEEDGRRRSRRRHVFEGLDLNEIEMKTERREDVGRINNLCLPPKNALLLMRCRSDPVKVAALANRVRERQMSLDDRVYEREEEEEEVEEERRRFELDLEDKKRIELCEKWISGETIIEREEVVVPVTEPEGSKEEELVEEDEEEASKIQEEEIEAMIIKHIEDDLRNAIEEEEEEETAEMEEEEREEEVAASVTPNVERSNQGNREPDPSPEVIMRGGNQEEVETAEKEEKTTPYKVLPDCLLLMMCEPKLSMEVSKETWVCSTDFVRCQPGRPQAKKITESTGEHHKQPKKRNVTAVDSNASSRRRSIDKRPVHLQPPRSSCSYPAAPPLLTAAASVREQKVVGGNNKAYEPPVLPRCKSEPRKSASKLAPEACFWKNRKLEPHSQASVGVGGGAGVGF
ncbi:HCF243 [Hirschfeldia incana]|nr:HCF243 [Hirschfeldia incana]